MRILVVALAIACMGASSIDPPAAMYTPRFIKSFPMDTVTEVELLQAWGPPTGEVVAGDVRMLTFDNASDGTTQSVMFTIKDGVVVNAAVRWGRGKWHRARE